MGGSRISRPNRSVWGCRAGRCGVERRFLRPRGRFGTHSSNENFTSIYYKRVMFFAHFNAGVRAVDMRDPYHPKRSPSCIRAHRQDDKRCVGERCKVAIRQTTSTWTIAGTSTSRPRKHRAPHSRADRCARPGSEFLVVGHAERARDAEQSFSAWLAISAVALTTARIEVEHDDVETCRRVWRRARKR